MPATLSGVVWNDLLADGVHAAAEPPVANVSVVLLESGSPLRQTITNGSGAYSFAGVAPGACLVALIVPPGATQTFPQGAPQIVQVDTADVPGVDFGVQIAAAVPANTDVTAGDDAVQQMPSVAVDPTDPNHVAMAYMDYSGSTNAFANIGVAISHDDGATWTRTTIARPTNFDDAAGQPVAQFDANGHLHVEFMAAKYLGQDQNGAALKPGVIYDPTNEAVSYLTTTGTKTVSRRIYSMQANNGIFLASSSDDGATWTTNAITSNRYDLTATTGTVASSVAANNNGTITPAVMPAGLFVGEQLIIDEGLATMQRVKVTAIDNVNGNFTATFIKAHGAGAVTISTPVVFDALPDFAIDNNLSSPNFGNIYATFTRFYPASQFPGITTSTSGAQIMVSVSTDGGLTWTPRTQGIYSAVKDPLTGTSGATTTEGSSTNAFSRVAVGPEGGVYISQISGGRFDVFYSNNAGVSFRNPVPDTTNTMSNGYPFGLDSNDYTAIYASGLSTASFSPGATLLNNTFRTIQQRAIAADPTRPGYIYAVEAVAIFTTNGTSSTPIDRGEITFSRSTDYGVTWNPIFTVGDNTGNLDSLPANLKFRYRSALNDDNGTNFTGFATNLQDHVVSGQAMPALSVDEKGNIAVIWYDTRRDPGNKLVDVYGTVSTDGGQTFSVNNRITAANFNADNGKFTTARNDAAGVAFNLGDRLGLVAASGNIYAAWTGTTSTLGNQDIYFSKYTLQTTPFTDRYEPNDSQATATDLGSVATTKTVPLLSLAGADDDWFKVKAGTTGQFLAAATAALLGSGINIEAWDSTGTTLLASGSAVLSNGQTIGQQLSVAATANQVFLVHVSGVNVPNYTLTVQAITADLGTTMSGTSDRTVAASAQDVYQMTAIVDGSLDFSLTPGNPSIGNLSLTILNGDGTTVLATGNIDPAKNQTANISLPVVQGQKVLVQVASVNTTSVLVRNGSASITDAAATTLTRGSPGAAVIFGTNANGADPTKAVIQVDGAQAVNVRVNILNASGLTTSSTDYLLQPNTPVTITGLVANAGFSLQALDPIGTGPYHLAFTNFDIFESSQKSEYYPLPATPSAVIARDMNVDGHIDLVMTSTQSDQAIVMLANADGTFQAPRLFVVSSGATGSVREPAVADVDADTIPDVIVPDFLAADVSVLRGAGDGDLTNQTSSAALARASAVAAGDFNHDNNIDVAVVNGDLAGTSVAILLNPGDGKFAAPKIIVLPQLSHGGAIVRAGDVDNDSRADLIVFGPGDMAFQVLHSRGNGMFDVYSPVSTFESIADAQLADMDGDGRLDIVVAGSTTGNVMVYLGMGDGSFRSPVVYATAPAIVGDQAGVVGLAIGDFGNASGPGAPDILLDIAITTRYANGTGAPALYFLPGTGAGTFSTAQKLATLNEAGRIAAGDFNGDNVQDLAMTETGGVRLLFGQKPVITTNTTPATPRVLGPVVQYTSQTLAIVPGFTDAYYQFTVRPEAQKLEFTAIFQAMQGTGLAVELLDSTNNVLASGSHFVVNVVPGSVFTLHVFGQPASGALSAGMGAYTFRIQSGSITVGNLVGTFTAGTAGTFQLPVTGSPTFTLTLIGAPAWLSINASNQLIGTPPIRGSLPYTIRFVIKASNDFAALQEAVALVVNPPMRLPTLLEYVLGKPNNVKLSAIGGTGPLTYTVSAIDSANVFKATGLTIRGNGTNTLTLTGTSTKTSTVFFTVTITDSLGATSTFRVILRKRVPILTPSVTPRRTW